MSRLRYIIPAVLFVAIAAVLYVGIRHGSGDEIPTVLNGGPIPDVTLPPLDARTQGFGPADLKGQVTLVNVFASWCIPCREEAPVLARLARENRVRLVGLVYKDTPGAARAFLDEYGNPFERIGLDSDGRAGIWWGISKVPETFLVDKHGVIRGRFGPLSEDDADNTVLPAIRAVR
ncbi:MAG: DsbE family thiol:disulfide interchange protein [Alphaproteobacteria bacterium]|nr:DsbE family thiol:disulfide interchange protein [Alphaproteobacteria bacterium]MBL6936689.1 DsbE family thiol:disulfide interchange protein [Alphaproteobacteria bacterium]MBL7097458.1 DsbE family thiol:disulfide interchange protein [Alphaproteobacteria bacterium]